MSYTALEGRSREAFTDHCIQTFDTISDNQAETLHSPFLKLPEDLFPSRSTFYGHIEYSQDLTRTFFGNCQCYIERFAGY